MPLELVPTGVGVLPDSGGIVSIEETHYWQPVVARATWVASATVGNRKLQLRLIDTQQNMIAEFQTGVTVTAGDTRIFDFYAGAPASAAFVNTSYATLPIPNNLVYAGVGITMNDVAAIDPEGDTVTIQASYVSYELVEK